MAEPRVTLRSAVRLPLVVAAAWCGFVLGAFAYASLSGDPLPVMAWVALVSAATCLAGMGLAARLLDRVRADGCATPSRPRRSRDEAQ